MAVAQIFVFRPRPGHFQDFMKDAVRADKLVRRAGGKMRAWNAAAGGEPGTIGIVIETADWKAFGEYNARLESDTEWQAFMAEINSRREPSADMVRTQISVELPIG
jgi:hypothetical protein